MAYTENWWGNPYASTRQPLTGVPRWVESALAPKAPPTVQPTPTVQPGPIFVPSAELPGGPLPEAGIFTAPWATEILKDLLLTLLVLPEGIGMTSPGEKLRRQRFILDLAKGPKMGEWPQLLSYYEPWFEQEPGQSGLYPVRQPVPFPEQFQQQFGPQPPITVGW